MIMHRLSPEEYIVATIELYLDIINLFIEILKILDKINRKWTVRPEILSFNLIFVDKPRHYTIMLWIGQNE